MTAPVTRTHAHCTGPTNRAGAEAAQHEAATRGHAGALWAQLEALHRALADTYGDLARCVGRCHGDDDNDHATPGVQKVEVCLAAGEEQSDITDVEDARVECTPAGRRSARKTAQNERPLISATALAKRLDVDPKTVRRWRGEGRLPEAIQVGSVIRWTPESIDEWIASGGEM